MLMLLSNTISSVTGIIGDGGRPERFQESISTAIFLESTTKATAVVHGPVSWPF